MRTPRPRRFACVLAIACGLLGVAQGWAGASPGSDRFLSSAVYHGDFPDPSIIRVGSTYYAFSTNMGHLNLPEMTSTDLITWRAHRSNAASCPTDRDGHCRYQNEAMPTVASWAVHPAPGSTWAPGVAHIGTGYVVTYVVRRTQTQQCLTVATAASPLGPFVDRTAGPLVCPSNQGATDPSIYTAPDGVSWLLWKTEGRPGVEATKLYSRRLNASGTAFGTGSVTHLLSQTSQKWEGHVVENPSMIAYGGRYYLFYSANEWTTAAYAIGYAVCSGPQGPCTKPQPTPLLSSTSSIAGPGGPTPIVGGTGHLRLGYAAWDAGRVGYPTPGQTAACFDHPGGCNQRKLHVATLSVTGDGLLAVSSLG